ncbi:hypothetical protein EYZ11_005186 [Aspergillus tanneri]|uniref:Uncharacterized protein n=1 Tax=Aspergillus tanneri TaxID=1220188 RepID=A0A4S3JII8_9EURO|nr:hypothetical protein EYZ11_005186 [Aspergillus tanneri]
MDDQAKSDCHPMKEELRIHHSEPHVLSTWHTVDADDRMLGLQIDRRVLREK